MAQTIKIKRSTGSAAPSTLASGELAFSKGTNVLYIGDPAAANTPIILNPNTNITVTENASTVTIASSTGTDDSIAAATTSLAGVMTAADKTKLDGIEAGAEVNVATNLGNTPTGTSLTITSSTGTDTNLPAATTTTWGVMTDEDKTKLDGIATGAEVNVGTNLTVTENASTVTIASSTGDNDDIQAATTSLAGVMSATDKTKLNGIEALADVTDATNVTSSLVAATAISAGDQTTIQSNLDVDPAGTDNSTDVTLAGSLNYITIDGQEITRNAIDLSTDVTGSLPNASVSGLGTLATLNEVNAATIADDSVGAAELNVSGNGTSGQALVSDGDGTFTWSTISVTDNDVNVANLTARLPQITENVTIGDATDVTVTTSGDLVVTGDLTVSGTTTTVNSETLTVDDNIIVLNNNVTGTPTENAGIEIERGTSANVLVRWNESNTRWEFTNDGSTYYNIPLSTEYTNNAGDITSVAISSTDSSISGVGTGTAGDISFDLQVATIDGGTY